jgi:ATPase, YjeE family
MIYISLSEIDTKKIARTIAKNSERGNIFCLEGELGSGKTFFVKEFAYAIGIKDYVSSPTFSIINEYHGPINLYHFDAYRISSIDEMEYTNYEDYFYGDGICIIEWATIIKEIIPDFAKWIYFSKDLSRGENYRSIKIID